MGEFHQSLQSLSTRFDNFQRNNDNRSNGKGGRGSNKGNSRNNGRNNGGRNNSGRKGKNNKNRRRNPYDTNKSCELHGRGHSTEECNTLKKQAREQQSSSGRNQQNQRNSYSDYQPNFNRQFTTNVTRLSVNNVQLARTSDPSAWIVDSAANAFITPFKERLHNYRHYKEEVQVKGFDGKPEVAVGSGSITLTDHRGNRL